MRVSWPALVSVVIALLVPGVLMISGIRVLAHPTLVRAEYRRSGFPPDTYGFTTAQRERLGIIGLHSVLPGGPGLALLRSARLPDGSSAFGAREVRHMADVRVWIGRFWTFQFWALVAIAVAAVALLISPRTRPWLPRGLRWGGLLTLALAGVIAIVMAVSWNTFFVDFHHVFFAGDTWRFDDSTTLRRIYPDQLWVDVGIAAAGWTIASALALIGITTLWLRRYR
jgi:integral membrane protein (TIGR01906 family)